VAVAGDVPRHDDVVSATAANAPIVGEFHLTAAETAWLTMAVQPDS
jgi:hypothetical protein